MLKKFKVQKVRGASKYRVYEIAQTPDGLKECNAGTQLDRDRFYWGYIAGGMEYMTEDDLLFERGSYPKNMSNTYYKFRERTDWVKLSQGDTERPYITEIEETKTIEPQYTFTYHTAYSPNPNKYEESTVCENGRYAWRKPITRSQINEKYSDTTHEVPVTDSEFERFPLDDRQIPSLEEQLRGRQFILEDTEDYGSIIAIDITATPKDVLEHHFDERYDTVIECEAYPGEPNKIAIASYVIRPTAPE